MNLVIDYFGRLGREASTQWNRFWFVPVDPATLGMVRILAGAMLLYTHLVWALDLEAFFGTHAWISPTAARAWLGEDYSWSYLWLVHSNGVLWALHLAGLIVFAMLTVGLHTRIVSVLAFVIAISYVNRVPGALFGLDQINVMLAMYLMLGPSGDAWSLDRWRARRGRGGVPLPVVPTIGANIATRLMQVHMAIIYFFAGLSKMQGASWWEGTAMWGAISNLEYQSLDMTWTVDWPFALAFATHLTAWWELTFPVVIWPRILRPLVLSIAVPLHLGIGLMLGMWTFGLVMLIGVSSFIPPEWVRAVVERGRAGGPAPTGGEGSAPSSRRTGSQAVGSAT